MLEILPLHVVTDIEDAAGHRYTVRCRQIDESGATLRAVEFNCRHLFLAAGEATARPLGGAIIGRACDTFGRVAGYKNLYVVDGALIPGATGCANPSFTIAALAERCMDALVPEVVDGRTGVPAAA